MNETAGSDHPDSPGLDSRHAKLAAQIPAYASYVARNEFERGKPIAPAGTGGLARNVSSLPACLGGIGNGAGLPLRSDCSPKDPGFRYGIGSERRTLLRMSGRTRVSPRATRITRKKTSVLSIAPVKSAACRP